MAHEHDDTMGIAETSVIRCQMCTVRADFDAVVAHMGEVTAIGKRLKPTGARGKVRRLERMAALRCLHYGDQFESYWKKAAG